MHTPQPYTPTNRAFKRAAQTPNRRLYDAPMHTSKANNGLMRELNERIVLSLLRQEGTISRAELARRSKLSRSTVSSIVADLLAAKLVRETGSGDSRGGRRPIMIALNEHPHYAVGMEIGNGMLTLLVVDLVATVLLRKQRAFAVTSGPHACVAQVATLLSHMLSEAGISRGNLLGVGVGVPGIVASATGRLAAPAMPPGWHDAPLRAMLESSLDLPVIVENDARLGALAERRWGAARGWNNVVCLFLGSPGISCGLILDGRLYHGDMGAAGDIGQLPVVHEPGDASPAAPPRSLQAAAGTPALLARAREHGLACAGIEDLVRLAQQGNARAIALVEQAGASLGSVLASLLAIVNPGVVVIGGGLAAAGDILLQAVRGSLARQCCTPAIERVAIVRGELGADVVALGGAAALVQQTFDMPAAALPSIIT